MLSRSVDQSPFTAAEVKLVTELEPVVGTRPQLQFLGPVDTVATAALAEDVVAVVRESLSNVAKHAAATRVDLTVDARGGRLSITVRDNGVGLGTSDRRSGSRQPRTPSPTVVRCAWTPLEGGAPS